MIDFETLTAPIITKEVKMNSNIQLTSAGSNNGFLGGFVEANIEKPPDGLNGDCIVHYSGQYSKYEMTVKLVKGMREGCAIILNDGVPFMKLEYRNGSLTGIVERMNRYGMVELRGHLVNGVERGLFEECDNSDKVVWRGYYRDGRRYSEVVKSGRLEGYYDEKSVESGSLFSIAQYDDSLHDKNGRCMEYENGEWVGEWVYENGVRGRPIREYRNGTLTLYDDNGRKTFEGQYSKEEVKDGFYGHEPMEEMDGYCKEVDSSGQVIIAEYDVLRMRKNGKCFELEDGKVNRVCLYENDEMKLLLTEFNGSMMKEYNSSGQIVYEGGFKGSMKNGFMRNGNGKEYVRLVTSSGNGLATERNESTTLIGTWKNGKKDGEFYELDAYSLVKRTCLYVNNEMSRVIQEFNNHIMTEYNEQGLKVYEGAYKGNMKSGFVRNGKGFQFNGEGSVKQLCIYENGEMKRVIQKFNKDVMMEFDLNGKIVYEGGYSGDLTNGFVRDGKGYCFKDSGKGYCFKDSGKGYCFKNSGKGHCFKNSGKGYCFKDSGKGYCFKDSGKGYCFKDSGKEKQGCYYEKGKLIHVTREVKDGVMKEYDENGRVRYIGGFKGNEYVRNGRGYIVDETGVPKQFCEFVMDSMKRVIQEYNGNEMTEYDKNGKRRYVGGFKGDVKNGFVRDGDGTEYDGGSRMAVYSGQWKNGKRNGLGTEYKQGRSVYSGEWKNGKRNGKGKEMDRSGKVVYSGKWRKGCHSRLFSLVVALVVLAIVAVLVVSVFVVVQMSQHIIVSDCSTFNQYSVSNSNRVKTIRFKRGCNCERLEIGDGLFENTQLLEMDGLSKLESIVIGERSFQGNGGLLKIANCERLESIVVGDESFEEHGSIELTNLVNLQSIVIGSHCFVNVPSLSLTGLNALQSIRLGSSSFGNVHSVVIGSSSLNSIESFPFSSFVKMTALSIGSSSLHELRSFPLTSFSNLHSIQIGSDSLPSVVELELRGLWNLERLEVGEGGLSGVERIVLNDANLGVLSVFGLSSCESNTCLTIGNSAVLKKMTQLEIGNDSINSVSMVVMDGVEGLESLVIGEDCMNGNETIDSRFVVQNCSNLKSIVVKKQSFMNYASVVISNCNSLQSLTVGNAAFQNAQTVEMADLPQLNRIVMGVNSLRGCNGDNRKALEEEPFDYRNTLTMKSK